MRLRQLAQPFPLVLRLQAAQERCSLLRGAIRDPSSDAELLLTCSRPCTVCGLLWQSFWFRSSSERRYPPGYLHVMVAIRGNLLTSACCQQPSLLQSQLASGISTLNVLDLYLKLSGLEGQGQ